MRKPVYSGRRVAHFTAAVTLVLFAISVFWFYRVRAAEEAVPLAPIRTNPVLLPAGMSIQGLIRNGIAASAVSGDTITAFVSTPVVLHDRLVIPSSAQLKGNLDKFSVSRAIGQAYISFTGLLTGGRAFAIQTRQVVIITPVRSDIQILSSGLKAVVGASFGAAIGAASGDAYLMTRGLIEGARVTGSDASTVPITVTLIRDLEI